MTLDKRPWQLFCKRLRKRLPVGVSLRYYMCGEYGGKKNRPHYHAIMFNVSATDIAAEWTLGELHFGEVNGASIGYTLKYMCKPRRIPMHRNDDRLPEFSLMSKGLGANYLTDAMCNWHRADVANRVYVPLQDGQKIAMPRYYKQKLYTIEDKGPIQAAALLRREQQLRDALAAGQLPTAAQAKAAIDAAFRGMYKSQEKRKDL